MLPMRLHTASSLVQMIRFLEPSARLQEADGGGIGVRGPLRDTEAPAVRPYWLVDDIEAALDAAAKQGAFVAHSPLEIPGKGTFAIYIQGDVEHGLWQL
ncbi:MAG TPA: hypothetical protein V6D03_15895 [Candidatus Caenarcaniphilales bacterium]